MKHGIKGRKLNRTSTHRKALFINLSRALIEHEQIKTTLPKAKDLRPFIEKIITLGKKDSLANRRQVLSLIKCKELTQKLFSDIAPRFAKRNGGYTRIMKFGFRTGDKAPMAIIELVERVAKKVAPKKSAAKKESKAASE
jgi:large subunit ribosomal protein L17